MTDRTWFAIRRPTLAVAWVCTTVGVTLSSAARDQAKRAGVPVRRLGPAVPRPSDVDYFRDMDHVLLENSQPAPALSESAIAGRNMWMLWTGGNDRLWDRLTIDSIGTFDLLKIISSPRRN